MFSIRSYEDKDLGIIERWLRKRGLPMPKSSDFPKYGWIISHDHRAVAAGFLRRCEGHTGIVDSMVTNPDSKPEIRNEALDILVQSIITEAKRLDTYRLIGFSMDANTLKRSERHGFIRSEYVLVVLEHPIARVET